MLYILYHFFHKQCLSLLTQNTVYYKRFASTGHSTVFQVNLVKISLTILYFAPSNQLYAILIEVCNVMLKNLIYSIQTKFI